MVVADLPVAVAVPKVMHDLRLPRINDAATESTIRLPLRQRLKRLQTRGATRRFQQNGPVIRDVYARVQPIGLNELLGRCLEQTESLARI